MNLRMVTNSRERDLINANSRISKSVNTFLQEHHSVSAHLKMWSLMWQ